MNPVAAGDADRRIALTITRARARPAIAALWALDAALGAVVAGTREPMLGQLRLTWWHDALATLRADTTTGQPVLDALAATVLPRDVAGTALAALVEGWEALLDPLPLDDAALLAFAEARGERLFALSAALLGGTAPAGAGAGWALADFARRCSDPATAQRAFDLARSRLDGAALSRLPRPLGVLAKLARGDARHGQPRPRSGWQLLRALY